MDNVELLSTEEVSRIFGCSEVFLRKNRDLLPYIKVGKLVRYRRQDVNHFIEQNVIKQTA